ncbi:MAG: NAD-dependent dehydratase [Acidobacteria bacterium]|nr:MAG: NAD-dependent dehydratase [Acidobacteriota bacterium]PYY07316.1 MAG: NAD-dependent dehydratase [Acidobacteriota bacterium]
MRVLVIGGTGFIGPNVVRILTAQGNEIAVVHRGKSNPSLPPEVRQILADRAHLRDKRPEIESFGPEVVIDLIISSGAQAEALMRMCHGLTRRVLMISSMDVYRACGVLHGIDAGPLEPLPLTENSALRRTRHPYPPDRLKAVRAIFPWMDDDYDKIPAERAVMSDPELPGTVLRLPMVYGPGDPLHRFYPIVKRILDGRRTILFSEPLAVWRSPRAYVENVAAAIALAAERDQAAGRIYNVAEWPAFSELEWAKKIAAQMRWQGEFVVIPPERAPKHLLPPPGNIAQHWVASSERIRGELAYREPVPLEEAIRRSAEWEAANPPVGATFYQFDYAAEDAALAA